MKKSFLLSLPAFLIAAWSVPGAAQGSTLVCEGASQAGSSGKFEVTWTSGQTQAVVAREINGEMVVIAPEAVAEESEGPRGTRLVTITNRSDEKTDWSTPENAEKCFVVQNNGLYLQLNFDRSGIRGTFQDGLRLEENPNRPGCPVPHVMPPPAFALTCYPKG